jgi:hypothetical protein
VIPQLSSSKCDDLFWKFPKEFPCDVVWNFFENSKMEKNCHKKIIEIGKY